MGVAGDSAAVAWAARGQRTIGQGKGTVRAGLGNERRAWACLGLQT